MIKLVVEFTRFGMMVVGLVVTALGIYSTSNPPIWLYVLLALLATLTVPSLMEVASRIRNLLDPDRSIYEAGLDRSAREKELRAKKLIKRARKIPVRGGTKYDPETDVVRRELRPGTWRGTIQRRIDWMANSRLLPFTVADWCATRLGIKTRQVIICTENDGD